MILSQKKKDNKYQIGMEVGTKKVSWGKTDHDPD